MKNNRALSLLPFAAVVICVAIIGFPWQSSERLGNFSGKLVYDASEGKIDVSGRFNLYNYTEPASDVQLRLVWDNREQQIEADHRLGLFQGFITFHCPASATMEALLVVDGQTVARGRIQLPAGTDPGIHIIRFSSVS
ncbi:MAG: hypothetical protein ACYTG7_00285 [Planctomycetota bacterium]|jgi:hypothetical protein